MPEAVVLAGGRSTRFGEGDKAVADLAGTPAIRRVADRLAGPVDRLVVNCRADQVEPITDALSGYPLPVTVAEDETPDAGPMAGIRDGLRAVDSAYALVVACDMPFVDPALVEYLFDRAEGRDGAVPRLSDGWFQTTQAVYRADRMADACAAALARDDGRIVAALSDLDYAVVEEAEVREHAAVESFENLNTREEFEAAADRL
ncbi:molybdenum cofactor guanylyltransferase [Halobacteriales archaeon QS_8_69_26]|nr:MAG: molybdenum cofactor guanylyltransferase [Halobacteriales archaeon QS_8_69_26]